MEEKNKLSMNEEILILDLREDEGNIAEGKRYKYEIRGVFFLERKIKKALPFLKGFLFYTSSLLPIAIGTRTS